MIKSDISRERNTFSSPDGFDPVIHEISHDEQMDNLTDHKPQSDIFRENRGRTVRVEFIELCISEDPEDDGKDSGNGL